ncbi:SMP-30/gluconolactonase/LRE family protein [Psychrosphaera sp. F3M07]|uniref:SMP-30/gluconolactonase/LRE family protein n=1 Tax=Psychrosphaera sp. F3M07 TaxID=2841560 RepID=UPI001C09118A|nr:SMP-30/gluconolactonase/LRE family protein [Psychrosphaera sp. F3M07]MBU2917194.1 SMP-30/gluconolactonase/LRE family protein [Psychrosphaera sp. F3M07]
MKSIKVVAVLTVTFFILFVLLWFNSSIHPIIWQPTENPKLSGVFSKNTKLDKSQLILQNLGSGPEDIVLSENGRFYTGFADGRIISFIIDQNKHSDVHLLTNTGGRPLGMKFTNTGELIVADAVKGLLSISMAGEISVLVNMVDGIKMKFVDHLDIAEDGTIWFSDASQRFEHSQVEYDFIEGSATGRLLSYSPDTGETKVHISDLFFANGVALGPKDEYVLINETGKAQIHRLWLKGDQKGKRDIFLKDLPAMPDNITFNGKDTFWIPLIHLREPLLEQMAYYPFIRKLIGGFPSHWIQPINQYGFVIGVNLNGEVITNLQSPTTLYSITSVIEYKGSLILGSLDMPNAAIFNLD